MFSERKNKANPTSLRKELMVVWGMEANSPLARRVGDPTPWEPWEMVAGHATLPWHRATPPCPSLPLSLPPPLSNPLSMVSSFRPQSLRQQKRRFLLSISSLYIFFSLCRSIYLSRLFFRSPLSPPPPPSSPTNPARIFSSLLLGVAQVSRWVPKCYWMEPLRSSPTYTQLRVWLCSFLTLFPSHFPNLFIVRSIFLSFLTSFSFFP